MRCRVGKRAKCAPRPPVQPPQRHETKPSMYAESRRQLLVELRLGQVREHPFERAALLDPFEKRLVVEARAEHVEATTRSPFTTMRWLSRRSGTRWNQLRTRQRSSRRAIGPTVAGTWPAVVHSRSKNLAELYQVPRR